MLRHLFVFLFCFSYAQAQKASKSDKSIISYLKSHVQYLSSDELEGRRAGTKGEQLAAEYIASKFREIGLIPHGDNNDYFQSFSINDGKQVLQNTFFKVNNTTLSPNIDFYPLAFSANIASHKAEVSPSLTEKEQPWMIDLASDLMENVSNPHFDINNLIADKLKKAIENKSSALILFNSSDLSDNIRFDRKDRTESAPIPIIFITNQAYKKYFKDPESSYEIEFSVSIGNATRNTRNVIGYIDNQAPLTIIIGAHFDHLGYGEDGNSMLRGVENQIHNGADDNASGTAALLELAFILKKSKLKNYNYLFTSFSAEELGLNGSKYFVEHPTIQLNNINYMINMDMVGRLNDSSKVITLGGVGTSPQWGTRLAAVKNNQLVFRYDSSGTGPSDHTSFYRKDIPVLFFFTGLHTDYHKPSDDADKINYAGELMIIRFIEDMIKRDSKPEKMVFTKTREQQTSTSARFSVSLGIMPDYSFSGSGVRVDGVSDNKPAKKGGIIAGDIIKQLGEHKITSVESYMQALSKFKKGDQTTVIALRGEVETTFQIVF